MKRIIMIVALLMGMTMASQAQFLRNVPDMKGKTVVGGNLGLGLNGRNFSFTIAPQIGYRIINAVEVGVRGTYSLSVNFDPYYGNSSLNCFGAGPYATIQVYKGLCLHAEDEMLYCLQRYNHQTVSLQNSWYNSVMVGGGYRSYYGNNSYAFLLILYNLSWDHQEIYQGGSPYISPLQLRVGYCFGL